MRQPLAIICDMNNPLVSFRQGLNVSEPLALGANPFPAPTAPSGAGATPGLPSNGATNLATNVYATPAGRLTYPDFYDDPDVPNKQFLDVPLEERGNNAYPITNASMQKAGTYRDCSVVLLQRLADATLPYNPPAPDSANVATSPINPYITVDWASLDLHVISGDDDPTNTVYSSQPIYYPGGGSPEYYFRSRQRGFLANSNTQLTSNPWPPITLNSSSTSLLTKVSPTYFGLDLANNSKSISPALDSPAFKNFPYSFDPTVDKQTLGSLNSTLDYPIVNNQLGSATNYFGEPFVPFPWLAWNNRPFSNAMELLNVPASAPGRLALEMTPDYPSLPNSSVTPQITSGNNNANPYYDTTAANIAYRAHWPFGHLLNMLQTTLINTQPSYGGGAPTFPNAPTSAVTAPHLYRLFDFVEVPSPFAGAERWYNPASFSAITAYEPPFNKLSRFRDPGRINLNTIFDDDVWDAAISQFPGMRSLDLFSTQMALSRQGDSGTVNLMNPAYPTRFANPFRPADSADLMPPVGTSSMRTGVPAYATLLRPDPTMLANATPQPLFQINSNNTAYTNTAGYNSWTSAAYPSQNAKPNAPGLPSNAHDTSRNPYFRNQALQKLGAVATTNSNCFAVWITIGYFEVEENRPVTSGTLANQIIFDAAHPDGFALGQELGIDTGNVTRHRGFFIIDRSIPVGFVPGSRLNTDDCVLVKRLIE
jgi:hypothetical protein